MNEIMKMYDPFWEMVDMFARPFGERTGRLADYGLKSVIKRPHNLVNVKNDDGQVVAQRLEIVTTPFKKEDVRVSITDNTLSVSCGSENIRDEENEDVVYRGISSQSYTFALKLLPTVDRKRITAENKDGVLKVNLPLVVEEEKKPETVEIEIG